MNKNYSSNKCQVIAFVLAVAVFSISAVPNAGAQVVITNVFGGVNAPNPDSISTTNTTLVAGASATGPVGPGFTGSVGLGIGALDTLTETINAGGNGQLTARESGQGIIVSGLPIGAGVGGNFSATKTFAGTAFVPLQTYAFTLTTTANATLSLLAGANVTLSTVNNGVGTTVFSASNGGGLLGLANVLNLFNGGTAATFVFTAPANVDTTVPITVNVSGALAASALGSTFTFTGASLTAIPEPGTVAGMAVGLTALVAMRFRRRRG